MRRIHKNLGSTIDAYLNFEPLEFKRFRKKYFRPIYGPFFDRLVSSIWHGKTKVESVKIAKIFYRLHKNNQIKRIVVYYDNFYSPPTYGDFYIIIMLANFLSTLGLSVSFSLIDNVRGGEVWSYLKVDEQDSHVAEQQLMLNDFLDKKIKYTYSNIVANTSLPEKKISLDPTLGTLHLGLLSFYENAPHFLQTLVSKYKYAVPNKFKIQESERVGRHYITWNIRKSIWVKKRDSTRNSIQLDFDELQRLFPDHDIKILSNLEGLNFVYETLFNTFPKEIRLENGNFLKPQENLGFRFAVQELLGSDFYFQRSGGGLMAAAIFSGVPYLYFSIERTNFYGHKSNQIVSWASKNQIYQRVHGNVENEKISKYLDFLNGHE